jgi:nitrate/nitrite transporter NarK
MLRRVIIASVIGNGLEWFDFVSYGYFAGAISKAFFPESGNLSLLLTYATFAIGFIVRPVGGVLLGAYADRHGRRRSLALLIAMMAFGTLTLGVTPSFAAIGIAAPLIVVLGRIVQGISIGGEWLADRFGAWRMFFLFTIISALISYPFFAYVLAAPSFGRLFTAQFVVLTVMGLLLGSAPGLYASMFPAAVRSTGMAISYNVAVTVFGGFSPLTVTWLIAATGSRMMPAFYIIAAAAISLVVVGSTAGHVRRLAVPTPA